MNFICEKKEKEKRKKRGGKGRKDAKKTKKNIKNNDNEEQKNGKRRKRSDVAYGNHPSITVGRRSRNTTKALVDAYDLQKTR